MVAAKAGERGFGRPMMGKALLLLGAILLVAQAGLLSWHVDQYWNHAAAHAGDQASALGMALVHAVNTLTWNPGAVLASAFRVLLSCWPLALVAAGVVLLKKNSKGR